MKGKIATTDEFKERDERESCFGNFAPKEDKNAE